jgi:hypothetical protein
MKPELEHMITLARQSGGRGRREHLLRLAQHCAAHPKDLDQLTPDDQRDLSAMLREIVGDAPPEKPKRTRTRPTKAGKPTPPPAPKPQRKGRLARGFGGSVPIFPNEEN